MRSVLSVAGSDSSGGAGIQADIKTIEALGLFAQTAVTALTAQNTLGVAAVAAAIASALRAHGARNVVLDPVMVATSGAALASGSAMSVEVDELFPLATVITPNIPEAEALLVGEGAGECRITCEREARDAALELAMRYGTSVLVKGGHGTHDANDVLVDVHGEVTWLRGERIDNPNTHGTGCTLSSAIACGLALGMGLPEAVAYAKDYLTGCLRAGLDLGHGSGPLDHMWAAR